MARMSVTRVFEISYAHHLPGYKGECKNIHGHNARIEVEFSDIGWSTDWGRKSYGYSEYPCMVVDFKDVKKIVEPIVKELDHAYLNDVFGPSVPPTAEMICLYIVNKILETKLGPALYRVTVSETDSCYATWER